MTMAGPETTVFAGSSHIERATYDPSDSTLVVGFQDGRRYKYQAVGVDIYAGLVHAPSKGRFFDRYIRDAFPYEEV